MLKAPLAAHHININKAAAIVTFVAAAENTSGWISAPLPPHPTTLFQHGRGGGEADIPPARCPHHRLRRADSSHGNCMYTHSGWRKAASSGATLLPPEVRRPPGKGPDANRRLIRKPSITTSSSSSVGTGCWMNLLGVPRGKTSFLHWQMLTQKTGLTRTLFDSHTWLLNK